jgi:hypothetical protein
MHPAATKNLCFARGPQSMKPRTFQSALCSGVCLILCPLLVAQQTAPIAPSQASVHTGLEQTAPTQTPMPGLRPQAALLPSSAVVAKGVQVKFVLLDSVSSRTATKGQPVRFAVAEDVWVDGIAAIPRGTPAKGVIMRVRKGVPGAHDGSLTLEPREVLLASGSRIKLGAYPPGEDNCGNLGPCWAFTILLIAVSPLFIPLFLIETPRLIAHRIREQKKSGKARITGRDASWEPCQLESAYTSSNPEAFPADAVASLSARETILRQLDNCSASNQGNSRNRTIPPN